MSEVMVYQRSWYIRGHGMSYPVWDGVTVNWYSVCSDC